MIRILCAGSLVCLAGASVAETAPEAVTYQSCRVCHGAGSGPGAIPSLEKLDAKTLASALKDFTAKSSGTIMHRFTAGFSEAEIDALATYIAGLGDDQK